MQMLSLRGSVAAIRLLTVKESCLATGTMRFVPRQALPGGRTPTEIVIKHGLPFLTHSRRAGLSLAPRHMHSISRPRPTTSAPRCKAVVRFLLRCMSPDVADCVAKVVLH